MQLKSLSFVTNQLQLLALLEIRPVLVTSEFWVSQQSRDCCWTDYIAGTAVEQPSLFRCAAYSARRNSDNYNYTDGLCHMATPAANVVGDALFKLWTSTGQTREVARNKPILGTPPFTFNVPEMSIDGDPKTMFHSADETPQPWILVNLQYNVWVTQVRILLKTINGHHVRTKDIQVLLGTAPPPAEADFGQYTEVAFIGEALAAEESWQEFEVSPPLCSRYAVVTKKVVNDYPYNLLQLLELEVLAAY